MEIGDSVENANGVNANGVEVLPVENGEGLGVILLGVIYKVDAIVGVVLALLDLVGVDITVLVIDSLAEFPLVGVVGKVGMLLEVVLALSDAVVDVFDIAVGIDFRVDITVIVVDSLARVPLLGVVGKVSMVEGVVLALSDAVEDAIGTAVRIDIGVDTTSMEYAYMSSSNSFILT